MDHVPVFCIRRGKAKTTVLSTNALTGEEDDQCKEQEIMSLGVPLALEKGKKREESDIQNSAAFSTFFIGATSFFWMKETRKPFFFISPLFLLLLHFSLPAHLHTIIKHGKPQTRNNSMGQVHALGSTLSIHPAAVVVRYLINWLAYCFFFCTHLVDYAI